MRQQFTDLPVEDRLSANAVRTYLTRATNQIRRAYGIDARKLTVGALTEWLESMEQEGPIAPLHFHQEVSDLRRKS